MQCFFFCYPRVGLYGAKQIFKKSLNINGKNRNKAISRKTYRKEKGMKTLIRDDNELLRADKGFNRSTVF